MGGSVWGSHDREGSMLPCSLPVHGAFHRLRLWKACYLTHAMGLAESICPFPTSHPEEFLSILPSTSRSAEGSEERQRVGSCLSPRYRLLICRGRSTKEEAGQVSERVVEHGGINSKRQKGVVSRWAAAAVTRRAPNPRSAKREIFLWTLGNKRHRAGRSGWAKSLAASILQKPTVPNPICLRAASWAGSQQCLSLAENLKERSFRGEISV